MKQLALGLFGVAALAALLWLALGEHAPSTPPGATPPRALSAPERSEDPRSEVLATKRERESAPSAAPERRTEPTATALCAVRGAIAGGELRDAVLAFRAHDGTLHLAALDPSSASYRLELPPGDYRACFASPWAAPCEETLRLREGEREQSLDLAPSFWPVLPIEVRTPAGTPLLAALGPERYGWRQSEGLGGLGIALECGGERTPLGLRAECIVRVPLPTTARLVCGALVLGEQSILGAAQKLVFDVDPALFDRGASARVTLRAIDARTRAGLARAVLLARHAFGSRRAEALDAEGRFALDALPAGALELRVEAPSHQPATRTLELEAGAVFELEDLALEPASPDAVASSAPRVRCELHVLAYPTRPVVLLEGLSGTTELARWTRPTIETLALPAGSYRVRSAEQEQVVEIAPSIEPQRLAWP